MLFIVSKDLSAVAKEKLSDYGEVIEFFTEGITYPSVSNHPDIFFCKVDNDLIYATNTPDYFIDKLKSFSISLIKGNLPVGNKYPSSAHYNAVVTEKYFIHNEKLTDTVLRERVSGREFISVKQGYTRCSLLPLKNESFITSDAGIYKVLSRRFEKVLLIEPDGILLPGESHGFFGGTAGVVDDKIFLAGSFKYLHEGKKAFEFVSSLGYEVIELADSPLFDCGSFLIIR